MCNMSKLLLTHTLVQLYTLEYLKMCHCDSLGPRCIELAVETLWSMLPLLSLLSIKQWSQNKAWPI